MNTFTAVLVGSAVIVVIAFIIVLEKKALAIYEIMPVLVICTVACVGRFLFGAVPQVQPATALVLIAGICLGAKSGFLCGALVAALSNIVFGHGPWTIWQIAAWGIIGLIGALAGKCKIKKTASVCILAFLSGLIYSVIVDMNTLTMLGSRLSLGTAATVLAQGVVFNLGHCAANAVFAMLLFKPIAKSVKRMQDKYTVVYNKKR